MAEAWANWVNTDLGGIGGRPVLIVTADSAAHAAQAQAAVKKLVEEDKVLAIMVNDTTSETAIKDYTAAGNIPVIGGSTNAEAVWLATPNYFMLGMTNPVSASSQLVAAKANGAKNFGAAVCAEVPACAEGGKLFEAVGPQVGPPFAGLVTAAATAPSYTAECLSLIEKKADYIQLGMAIAPGIRLYQECVKQGFTGLAGAANQSIVGPNLEGVAGIKFGGSVSFFPWSGFSSRQDVSRCHGQLRRRQAVSGHGRYHAMDDARVVPQADEDRSDDFIGDR